MKDLSKYSDKELREELDRRRRKARNAIGFVRCKDCAKPQYCKWNKRVKEGVWRICEDYVEN